MKIGVISDTHDNITNLDKAFKILHQQKVKLVFHCGDLSAPFAINWFKKLKIPVKAVFGNNEGDKVNILARIKRNKVDFVYAPKQGLMWDLKLKNKRIAVFHGHQQELTNTIVNSALFDLVFTGHTHIDHIKKVKNSLWINPGCICGWAGLDIKPVKPSLGIVDLSNLKSRIIYL
ncbi:hypothetical protein A3J78_01895 [Candidatus Beckwithbacteria bacterium RBG_13_35_6]|uniref:Phosphoesterase n=1 Tax=Candidatus Beckwithbacteria bacterium RBG_13_35_6 TaxID=1797456 RepID=A0A1F5DG53_9BACT|nr:MAG: hypothetical protein A3J78_01895 [Candidatus Beckwithbacteria bacterium RBG_13_35_6]